MDKPGENIPSQDEVNNEIKQQVKKELPKIESIVPKNEVETTALLNKIDPLVLAKFPFGKKLLRTTIVNIIDTLSSAVKTKEQKMIISKLDDVRIALNEAILKTGFTGFKNRIKTAYNRFRGRMGGRRTRRQKGGQEAEAVEIPLGQGIGIPIYDAEPLDPEGLGNRGSNSNYFHPKVFDEATATYLDRINNMFVAIPVNLIQGANCKIMSPDKCVLTLIYILMWFLGTLFFLINLYATLALKITHMVLHFPLEAIYNTLSYLIAVIIRLFNTIRPQNAEQNAPEVYDELLNIIPTAHVEVPQVFPLESNRGGNRRKLKRGKKSRKLTKQNNIK